jgi:FAD/FMN-containing dehydrogenase
LGWLMRKYGMTIDNLLEVDIVTADGQLLTASEAEHADLFWAVRGGVSRVSRCSRAGSIPTLALGCPDKSRRTVAGQIARRQGSAGAFEP